MLFSRHKASLFCQQSFSTRVGFNFFYLFIKFDKPERVCTIFTCKKGDKAFEKKCDIVWDDSAVNINVQKSARKKTKNISQVSLNPGYQEFVCYNLN